MSGAGWERPLIRPNSANSGGRRGARENYGGLSPRTFPARPGAIFARFAGSGFAAVRVRPARLSESGVGAGREFPECPGKGAERPAPHGDGIILPLCIERCGLVRCYIRVASIHAQKSAHPPKTKATSNMTSPRVSNRSIIAHGIMPDRIIIRNSSRRFIARCG